MCCGGVWGVVWGGMWCGVVWCGAWCARVDVSVGVYVDVDVRVGRCGCVCVDVGVSVEVDVYLDVYYLLDRKFFIVHNDTLYRLCTLILVLKRIALIEPIDRIEVLRSMVLLKHFEIYI